MASKHRDKRSKPSLRIGFPGEAGSLAHQAATKIVEQTSLSVKADLVPCPTFAQLFEEIEEGKVQYAVVPIENSNSGTLNVTSELLLSHENVIIVGEIAIREVYCLLTNDPCDLASIQSVVSHPNILDACSSFIDRKLNATERIASISTTDAARRVATAGNRITAAIATAEAASIHGLHIASGDIGNDGTLETRYVVVGKMGSSTASLELSSMTEKQSAVFALDNKNGSVFKLLSVLALRNINVIKLESLPFPSGPKSPASLQAVVKKTRVDVWSYLFQLDFSIPSHYTEEDKLRLWGALVEFSLWQRSFGVFPSQVLRSEKSGPTWDDVCAVSR